MVLEIREDGWTVSLRRFDTNDREDFVPYGGGREFGRCPSGHGSPSTSTKAGRSTLRNGKEA
jgi:hypothetical protein